MEPQLRPVLGSDHMVACHYAEQITDAMVGELVPIAKRGTAAVPYRTAPPPPPPVAPQAAPSPDDAASAGV